jgi:hypothetical protein
VSFRFDLRHNRRLRLKRPAHGMIAGGRVEIIDMSTDSLGVEHDFELRLGVMTFLEFWWGDAQMRLSCEVARTRPVKQQPGRYRSGLTIDVAASETMDEYRKRIEAALEQLRAAEEKMPPSM